MTPSPLMGEGRGEGDNLNLMSLRGAQRRGNPVEVEHVPGNHHCYGDEIANPRIKYGVAMTSPHPTLILSLSKNAL